MPIEDAGIWLYSTKLVTYTSYIMLFPNISRDSFLNDSKSGMH